jgi:FMN reductase
MALVVTLAGSPSATSRSAAVLAYCREQLAARGHETHAVNIRDIDADDLIHARFDSDSIKTPVALVERAHAIIVATPVYKAAYTGVLKLFLDILPANAFAGKVVLPIVSGAAPTHALVLDYALKPVLAALGTTCIQPGAYLLDNQFVAAAQPGQPPTFSPELETRLLALLDSFHSAL